MDESSQYYGLTKQEIETRKKMAAKFGRRPTQPKSDTSEEKKGGPNSIIGRGQDGLLLGRIQS